MKIQRQKMNNVYPIPCDSCPAKSADCVHGELRGSQSCIDTRERFYTNQRTLTEQDIDSSIKVYQAYCNWKYCNEKRSMSFIKWVRQTKKLMRI
jgi:hypothetical protein